MTHPDPDVGDESRAFTVLEPPGRGTVAEVLFRSQDIVVVVVVVASQMAALGDVDLLMPIAVTLAEQAAARFDGDW